MRRTSLRRRPLLPHVERAASRYRCQGRWVPTVHPRSSGAATCSAYSVMPPRPLLMGPGENSQPKRIPPLEFPMQVFVTGATGYVGSSVAAAFRRAGHRVRGLTRTAAKARRLAQQEIEPVVGDLADPKTYADVAAACAVLVHAAFEYSPNGVAKDRTALDALIDAGRRGARPKTLIFTSGVWVHGATGDGMV